MSKTYRMIKISLISNGQTLREEMETCKTASIGHQSNPFIQWHIEWVTSRDIHNLGYRYISG